MSIYKKYIRQIIAEEVEKVLQEQEAPAAEPAVVNTNEQPENTNVAITPGGDNVATDTGDAGLEGFDFGREEGGEDVDIGAEGDLGNLEGDEEFGGGGLGGLGGGFSGGGFSFGGSGEKGLQPDSEEEEATATTVGPEDVEYPADPVMYITDEAIKLLKTTDDPATILNTVKSMIQKYFEDFDDATLVIKTLWDTGDFTLRDVARRLLLFIKGV